RLTSPRSLEEMHVFGQTIAPNACDTTGLPFKCKPVVKQLLVTQAGSTMLPTLLLLVVPVAQARALEPIPDKLFVLTFHDSSKSQIPVAAPLLKKHGFSATFFVTEGFDFPTNKRDYLTWDEIAQLHRDGFEIGNHTRDHKSPSAKDPKGTREQFEAINAK